MKKSVLLGIAVALLALPVFAGDYKGDPWGKNVVITWQEIKLDTFPVKMKVPWYIRILDQDKLEILLEQKCGDLQSGTYPGGTDTYCFFGCRNMTVQCNFDARLRCALANTKIGGATRWTCWFMDGNTDDKTVVLKGSTTVTVCVKIDRTDLLDSDLSSQAGQVIPVADLEIWVQPNAAP